MLSFIDFRYPLSFLSSAVVIAAAPLAYGQTAPIAPSGWTAGTKADGMTVFTPPDLRAGEVYRVAVYDSAPLDGKPLEDWLRNFAGPANNTPGKLTAPLKIQVMEGTVASGTGVYAGPNATALGVIFLGVSFDGENVHALRVLYSNTPGLVERYGKEVSALTKAMSARARREAGSKAIRVPASVAKGMKRGGKLVPGVYVGNQYYGDELKHRFRVYLYPSGEYRVCDHNDKDYRFNTGTLKYNPNSGQIDIGGSSFDMTNSSIHPESDFCYYGRDSAGKSVIYAENDHGFSTYRTTLHYAGPSKRPSPNAEKAAKAAAEAEAKRYKYVTAPGQGVKPGQVAAILHYYDVELYSAGTSGMGTNTKDEAYLLLRDGTVHSDLPVAPDQLDVTRSRQREPNTWGRWRLSGGKYQVSWSGGPYQALPGVKVLPGSVGQRLQGRWGTGSSSASLAGSSYSLWGVTFSKNGRFVKDGRGGSGNSLFMQTGGAPAINTTYDDKGSFTSATGDNFVVGAGKKGNPRGNREGTYSINGYSMTLRYDNGQVARIPFFFSSRDQKTLWFEGNQLALDDKK